MKRLILSAEDWKAKHGIKSEGKGLGFSEEEQKWYGWSHRAYYGFGIGYEVKEGDVVCSEFGDGSIKPGFKCKTLADCKKLAKAYADSVS
jgi:hypothetical protein